MDMWEPYIRVSTQYVPEAQDNELRGNSGR